MMSVRCANCGASNAADDAFCGNCGTALSGGPAQATVESPGPHPMVDPAPPKPFEPPPETLVGPTQFCGNCGAENVATRTFCRVCGSTLTPLAAAATAATTAGSASRGAGSERPQQADGPQTARVRPAIAARQRGGGGWIVLLAVLGLLAGVLFVLLPSMLGSRPPTDADPTRPAATGGLQEAGLPAGDRLAVLPMRSSATTRATWKPS
jgi:hypothetical protein